jgi:hypothetical protein
MLETKSLDQILSTVLHPMTLLDDVLAPLNIWPLTAFEYEKNRDGQ